MDGQIFVSICIPAYNRIDQLGRLLDSIVIQQYQHFEVVITDDSPTDSIYTFIQSHALWPKIRYFKNNLPLGSPENWNEGLRRATGDWIKIMHDDDWFSQSNSLGEFVGHIFKNNVHFIFSAYDSVFQDGKRKRSSIDLFKLKRLRKKPVSLFSANRIGPPSVVLFKRDENIWFDKRMKWLVDVDFYIEYLKKHPGVTFIDKSLVQIGISASQVTQMSFGNPDVEIPERKWLFEKLGSNTMLDWRIYDQWWRFIRNFKIKDIHQLYYNDSDTGLPKQIPSMISLQKKIPSKILTVGFFSKIFMFSHFLYSRIRF